MITFIDKWAGWFHGGTGGPVSRTNLYRKKWTAFEVFVEIFHVKSMRNKTNLLRRIAESRGILEVLVHCNRNCKSSATKSRDFTIFLKTHFHRAEFPSILIKRGNRPIAACGRFDISSSLRTRQVLTPDILYGVSSFLETSLKWRNNE